MHAAEPSKVQIAPIHDIKGTSFDWHEVEHVDLVHFAIADVDKRWDGASQIQQGMEFDRALGTAKRCPIEQAQAKVDRGGVQGVHSVPQVLADQIGVAVELARSTNQENGHI